MNILKLVRPAMFAAAIALAGLPAVAQKKVTSPIEDSAAVREALIKKLVDSIDQSINYAHGTVPIKDIAQLNLPTGYKYVPADKATMILHDFWGNPKRDDVLGMIVKESYSVASEDPWAFVISYVDDGYVKDEDADKIDYDKMLKDIQESEEEINKERVKEGYPTIHLEDWASKPYYDNKNKVLHWAKRLRFSDTKDATLNYDVRILGRKGVLSLNAVGSIYQFAEIKGHIPDIVKMATFVEGNKYSQFNPSLDKVAAYTVGGLIAGKLIAKTGLLVLLLKNIKLILLAAFGGFAAFRRRIGGWFSRKKGGEEPVAEPAPELLATTEVINDETTTGPKE